MRRRLPHWPRGAIRHLYRTLNGYRRDLMVCDATARIPRNIVHGVFGRAAWFPDGKHLCVSRGTGDDSRGTWALWVLRADGTVLHQITRPRIGVADLDPAVAPDGQTIAFTRDTHRLRLRAGHLAGAGRAAGPALRAGCGRRDHPLLQRRRQVHRLRGRGRYPAHPGRGRATGSSPVPPVRVAVLPAGLVAGRQLVAFVRRN